MKKKRLVLTAFVLAVAGMAVMGCPSDTEEGRTIEGNLDFKGGQHQHNFDTPKIEHGEEYEVIFTIEDCDDAFFGHRLGGKISYKMDLDTNDEKILSGFAWSVPPVVDKDTKTYKWSFKAGEANADDAPIETDATTPAGGKQYFALNVFKGYIPTTKKFGVDGEFEVKFKKSISDWISEGTVTLGNQENTVGKGPLTEADMLRIRALPPRSKIVLTVNVTVNNTNAQPTYGVCGVGGWYDNNSLSIPIPAGAALGFLEFTHEFEIEAILALQPEGYQIAINPYNGATVTKAELFRPGP